LERPFFLLEESPGLWNGPQIHGVEIEGEEIVEKRLEAAVGELGLRFSEIVMVLRDARVEVEHAKAPLILAAGTTQASLDVMTRRT
jgi:hypothetical protein